MNDAQLPIGTVGTAESVVEWADLAKRVGAEGEKIFPAVYATSRMIALMELAAARALLPMLGPDEMSVGVTVDIEHTAPSFTGSPIRAEARFVRRDGKLYEFEVSARDNAGIIGKGIHKRAVVNAARLEARAADRLR